MHKQIMATLTGPQLRDNLFLLAGGTRPRGLQTRSGRENEKDLLWAFCSGSPLPEIRCSLDAGCFGIRLYSFKAMYINVPIVLSPFHLESCEN